MNIYSPQVIAYAREHNVTELQAYRDLKSREAIKRAQAQAKGHRSWLERKLGISPDWDKY